MPDNSRIASAMLMAAIFASAAAAAKEAPDTIMVNGRIFTAAAGQLHVEALAIRGERIVATGSRAEISRLAGPKTETIDLQGATVIPGINDAHIHLHISPSDSIEVQVNSQDPTWVDMRAGLAAAVGKAAKGALLQATMGPKLFHDPAISRAELDKVAPSNPVIITTFTGHAQFLNSAALTRFGVNENRQDPLGGRYERSADGKLTGVVREYAVLQLHRSMSDHVPDAEATAQLKKQLEEAEAFGITSLQDMSNAAPPEREARLLAQLPAPIRVRVMQMAGTTPTGRILSDGKPVTKHPAPNITVEGVKWMLDGVPLENTLMPRLGTPPVHGAVAVESLIRTLPLTFSATEMALMLNETAAAHQQLLLHVSGFLSTSTMLQVMQDSGGASAWSAQRVRFEHGDGITPALIPKVKAMGIVVVQNPSHLAGVKELFGTTISDHQPLKSLLDTGIPLGLGSDGPTNPYLNILFASLHPNRPSEAITREQAVIAYTAGSAYAEFAEQDKGTLEPGKLADLAVLSQDIFTVAPADLPKTFSVLTMVGGKIVYRKSTLGASSVLAPAAQK